MNQFADGRYEIAGEYTNSENPIDIHCKVHDCVFTVKSAKQLLSKPAGSYFEGCPGCKQEYKYCDKVTVNCAYCGKILCRPSDWDRNNKTNLAFCCREHKILAQSCGILDNSRYSKYSNVDSDGIICATPDSYRSFAFANYPHQCATCGYQEETDILEVHHMDGDRFNNRLSNLVILCPNCHKLITLKLYSLERNKSKFVLIKNNEPLSSHKCSKTHGTRKSRSEYTKRLIYCVEDNKYFITYVAAGEFYNVSDTAIRYAATRKSNYSKYLDKHFCLVNIDQSNIPVTDQ